MKHLQFRIILIIILSTMYSLVYGQGINYTINSYCKPNPYIQLINNRIDSIECNLDSTYVYYTWIDNCSINPIFKFIKINKGLIEIKMEDIDDEWAACNCEYHIKLALPKIQENDFLLKINDSILSPSIKRYNLAIVREFSYSPKTLKREIYSTNGIINVECFYDTKGKLIKEKFYQDITGLYRFEIDY